MPTLTITTAVIHTKPEIEIKSMKIMTTIANRINRIMYGNGLEMAKGKRRCAASRSCNLRLRGDSNDALSICICFVMLSFKDGSVVIMRFAAGENDLKLLSSPFSLIREYKIVSSLNRDNSILSS